MTAAPSAGRWVELGLALGARKPVLAVGEGCDCIFLRLPNVHRVLGITEVFNMLSIFADGRMVV